ncbi:amino acid ABC transporter permease [Carnobacterium gallinarum]|uniref:amino acid ABC transporter permease n=1 Tax=Carnobacterium gallinarum TaxID=2749 RepID=UPI00055758FF|nr:amino acid ABC transporter permease [Carnobacterium gallinarum]
MSEIQWQYIFKPALAVESLPFILQGLGYTVLISVVSMLIGTLLGFFLALMRMSKLRLPRWLAQLYISFMRGTPMLVFLFILYFGFPFIGIQFTATTAAIIGFSLNSSAYIAEVLRGSILGIDKGQWEASYALGMPYFFIMRRIILPQSLRTAVGPLSNVMLDLIKGTSLAAMITVPEIFQQAKIIGGREFDYMTMYILVALVYWGICSIFTILQRIIEKRFSLYTNE